MPLLRNVFERIFFMKLFIIALSLVSSLAFANDTQNLMDELDPFASNIDEVLKSMDQTYENETGLPSHLPTINFGSIFEKFEKAECYQLNCEIYAQVVKSEQKLYLYIHGNLTASWAVSTGIPGHETPLLNSHPNGRIYDAYTSSKFPGGDYAGLGNMPYAIFIVGGFAVHGTSKSNWPKLGAKASHGCIRLHPDNAKYLNRLIRASGIYNTWVSVQE